MLKVTPINLIWAKNEKSLGMQWIEFLKIDIHHKWPKWQPYMTFPILIEFNFNSYKCGNTNSKTSNFEKMMYNTCCPLKKIPSKFKGEET